MKTEILTFRQDSTTEFLFSLAFCKYYTAMFLITILSHQQIITSIFGQDSTTEFLFSLAF